MINFAKISSKIIALNRGINESKSDLQLSPSELSYSSNYMLTDGNTSGLTLVDGYEWYDGTTLASGTAVEKHNDGSLILQGDALDGGGVATEDGDTARKVSRDAIIEPPGEGPILSLFEYNDKLFAIRQQETTLLNRIHWVALDESEVTGWPNTPIDITGAVGLPDNPTNIYKIHKGRFANYNGNEKVVVLCNGISEAMVLYDDGATVTVDAVSSTYLPSTFPYICSIWNQRLLLAYPDGQAYYHQPGSDPTDTANWDPAIASAGVINLEDTISNFLVTPSSFFIFCDNMIKYLHQLDSYDSALDVDFVVKTFSGYSGAIWDTAQRIFGNVLFCDDRGISSLSTTDAYGDFKASIISRAIQSTYEKNKNYIIGAAVNRKYNQYNLYYNIDNKTVAHSITFSAEGMEDNKLPIKGATTINYLNEFTTGYESEWFGGADGYVYKAWKGAQSFNCEYIVASFTTSFYSYRSSTSFKAFKRLLFELSADPGTDIHTRCYYDYNVSTTPRGYIESFDSETYALPAPWATEDWSSFRWGGSNAEREFVYLYGIGTNMAVSVACKDKYHDPNTIHNFTTQYSLRAMDR